MSILNSSASSASIELLEFDHFEHFEWLEFNHFEWLELLKELEEQTRPVTRSNGTCAAAAVATVGGRRAAVPGRPWSLDCGSHHTMCTCVHVVDCSGSKYESH